MKCQILPCIFLLCVATAARAETFEQEFGKRMVEKRERFITLTVENDSLGNGTDRHYTSGVRLSWFDTAAVPPRVAHTLDPFLPIEINATTSVYYSLGQNLYSPTDIKAREQNPEDQPYAAFLYGTMGLITISGNHMDSVEATIGIVGPPALGRQTQKFVHDVIGAADPNGWDHQLETEPGLMLSWQRLWPEAYKAELIGLHFRTSPYVGATVGNIYTYASTGLMFQLVPKAHKWQGMPLRVRPAMPGSGYFSVPDDELSWMLFAGVEGRAVGRNIFLDGNTFEDSPSVDKKPLVGDASAGVAFTYGRAQLSYTLNWRSEEFHGQRKPNVFGAVSLGYRF